MPHALIVDDDTIASQALAELVADQGFTTARAETVKLGVINTYSGPSANLGEQIDRGIRLYVKQHEKDLPPGVKREIIRRDDTGPNPEVAKRIAQELITRDRGIDLLKTVLCRPPMP